MEQLEEIEIHVNILQLEQIEHIGQTEQIPHMENYDK